MNRTTTILLAGLFALSLPLSAAAMSHEKDEHAGHDHSSMKHDDHDSHDDHGDHDAHGHGSHSGMEMHGDMMILGNDSEDGVKAMAHLKDVSEAMGKMGMDATHHIMVVFVDEKTGKPITEGVAAVKIERPDDSKSAPVRLVGMDGHFGADIVLDGAGEYEFEVGTKLPDGKKRQFEFAFRK